MGGSDEVDPFPLCARISLFFFYSTDGSALPFAVSSCALLSVRLLCFGCALLSVHWLCFGCALLSEKDTFQGPEPVHSGRCGQVIVF